MQFKEIKTMKAPAPVGPYSQALEHNGMIFCSGQIALDPETGQMVGKTPAEQAEKLLSNLENVLKEAGLSFKNIIKTVIFLTDMAAFAEVNAVYEKRMNGHRPARSTVAAAALPKGALVEIECIAIRD
jgi:2-iminobutanoate/2-iminopropanoate deaminase